MLSASLTMMRMYQPFTNSSLSDTGASFPLLFLQYWLYSWLRHRERELGSTATCKLKCWIWAIARPWPPYLKLLRIFVFVLAIPLLFIFNSVHLRTAGESPSGPSACRGWRRRCRSGWWHSRTLRSGRGLGRLKGHTIENEGASKQGNLPRFPPTLTRSDYFPVSALADAHVVFHLNLDPAAVSVVVERDLGKG